MAHPVAEFDLHLTQTQGYQFQTTFDKAHYGELLTDEPPPLGADAGPNPEIDVKATLKEKLDEDFRRYVILGACNPPLAHEALSSDLAVGVLLPCNVVIYEMDASHTIVQAIEPMSAIGGFGASALEDIAKRVRDKLDRVMERI